MRPESYLYWEQLLNHIGSPDAIFNGEIVYPRQLEIHLPGNQKEPCNFNCGHCAGHLFEKSLGAWEMDGLELLRNLGNNIPFHIYGGSYTEPLLNPYFMAYLSMTKRCGCHFGIHTNGSALLELEETQGWLTELARIATDKVDYLSVSLDAGTTASHVKGKNLRHNFFSSILSAIRLFTEIRHGKPAIRLCYLMNRFNSSREEINRIVAFARSVGVDSLRFSIPFANYNQSFSKVRSYRDSIERRFRKEYFNRVKPYLSTNLSEEPFVFWMDPAFQDIDLFDFKQCIYGFYQCCLGADGYLYRCTTISTPSFKQLRLGKITSNLADFQRALIRNQDPKFNCNNCFKAGARCNRMGLEINREWAKLQKSIPNRIIVRSDLAV